MNAFIDISIFVYETIINNYADPVQSVWNFYKTACVAFAVENEQRRPFFASKHIIVCQTDGHFYFYNWHCLDRVLKLPLSALVPSIAINRCHKKMEAEIETSPSHIRGLEMGMIAEMCSPDKNATDKSASTTKDKSLTPLFEQADLIYMK